MNKIDVKLSKTKFSEVEHLTIFIDEKQLDEILDELYPEKYLLGLVPAFLDWYDNSQKEKQVLINRALLDEENYILPVLLCPDDYDFWCTVVVAEVQITGTKVIWKRIGLDHTSSQLLFENINNIGSSVEWLSIVNRYEFDKSDYFNKIDLFFKELIK